MHTVSPPFTPHPDAAHGRHFERHVLPHLDAAYGLARWLARTEHDAEDVLQEAMLRAYRYYDIGGRDNVRAWLLTIVRNTFYTWAEQRQRHKSDVEYDEAGAGLEMIEAGADETLHGANPEQLLLRAADQKLVEAALLKLPAEYREILVLRELEELSYKEIAAIVGVPLGTVMSRLSRARLQLRQQIEAMDQP